MRSKIQIALNELRIEMRRAESLLAHQAGLLHGDRVIANGDRRKVELIVKEVCAEFEVERKSLFLRTRLEHIALARQVVLTLARTKIGMTTTALGAFFLRSASAAWYSQKSVGNRLETDPAFRRKYDAVAKKVERKLK